MAVAARALALVGSALLVVGSFVPINRGGEAGYEYALYDNPVDLDLRWFALQPLGAAALAVAVVGLSFRLAEPVLYVFLAGFAAQTCVFFFGYLGNSVFGPPAFNSLGPGSLLGLGGGLVLVASGALGAVAMRRRPDRR